MEPSRTRNGDYKVRKWKYVPNQVESTMSRKERLLFNTIDVEQEYKVIGLDLAKNDTSCVCIAESVAIIAIDSLN